MEDDPAENQNQPEFAAPKVVTGSGHPKRHRWIIVFMFLVIVGLAGALGWYVWRDMQKEPRKSSDSDAPVAHTGPCNGDPNTAPDGYTFYENETLGYRFAYPEAWGDVSISTDPQGGTDGQYLMGNFADNEDVWFGGNATDYVVGPRGGMPTDSPGYLAAAGQYYSVEIMRHQDGPGGEVEERHNLHLITETSELKAGCNTQALLTQYTEDPEVGFLDYDHDLAQFNLQPDNVYYGVSFVLRNPAEETRADFDNLLGTFQIIP